MSGAALAAPHIAKIEPSDVELFDYLRTADDGVRLRLPCGLAQSLGQIR
jgi:hypothetical protein